MQRRDEVGGVNGKNEETGGNGIVAEGGMAGQVFRRIVTGRILLVVVGIIALSS